MLRCSRVTFACTSPRRVERSQIAVTSISSSVTRQKQDIGSTGGSGTWKSGTVLQRGIEGRASDGVGEESCKPLDMILTT